MTATLKPALLIPLAILILGAGCGGPSAEASDAGVFTAKKGPVLVTVTESATLFAAQSVTIRSEVEGRAAILELIEEGKYVHKGDPVGKLDVSGIKDREENQSISVSRAKSAFITAEKNLEIQRNQNASDVESGRNDVLFTRLDLEKFLGEQEMLRRESTLGISDAFADAGSSDGIAPTRVSSAKDAGAKNVGAKTMGERKQQLVAAMADIEIAEEEVKRAENRLKWTRELHTMKYVTDNDLEADELALKKARKQETLATNRLYILQNYTLKKSERELIAKVKEALAELERTKLRCEAKLAQQEAELRARRQELDLEQAKLDKYRRQIKAGDLIAPADGLVVYAMVGDRRRREPVTVGTEVRESQQIIKLPDVNSMRVKASINETQVKKVRPKQTVEIKVDAIPDKTFFGAVRRVAEVPDSNSSWFSPDKQVYSTFIDLVGDTSALRDGQSCTITIQVARLTDVIAVPIQAIQRSERVLFVWKRTSSGATAVPVETGLANNQFVQIKAGVSVGDSIYLHTPAGEAKPALKELNAKLKNKEDSVSTKQRAAAKKKVTSASDTQTRPARSKSTRGDRAAIMKRYTEFTEAAKKRFPADAKALAQRGALFRNRALRQKLLGDPGLSEQFPDVVKRMKSMGTGRRRGGGGRGTSGRRGSGSRQRSGPGRTHGNEH